VKLAQDLLLSADGFSMKTHVLVLSVLALAVVFCATAGADAIPFAYAGPGLSVAGTLFGNNNHDGSWTITGIDATYNQLEVSEIVATGLDPHFLYNNLYYDTGYAAYAVDYLGVVFAVPGLGHVNLCSYTPSGGCGSGGYASILWAGDAYQLTQVKFTQLSQSNSGPPVPEPSTLALWGGALAAAGGLARRYLRG
jgi:PEP-CTERM motif